MKKSRPTFAQTMAPSSLPWRSGTGLPKSRRRPPISSQAAPGRTAAAKASTASPATNFSTARSSTRSRRPRSRPKHGGSTTTPSAHAHRSDSVRRHPRPSSPRARLRNPGELCRARSRWCPRRPSTNIPSGPLDGRWSPILLRTGWRTHVQRLRATGRSGHWS
jgi:hypothetical protein